MKGHDITYLDIDSKLILHEGCKKLLIKNNKVGLGLEIRINSLDLLGAQYFCYI